MRFFKHINFIPDDNAHYHRQRYFLLTMLVVYYCSLSNLCAQTPAIDSLTTLISQLTDNDTSKTKAYNALSVLYWRVNAATSLTYAESAIALAHAQTFIKAEAEGYRNAGVAHWYRNEHIVGMEALQTAKALYERIGDSAGIGKVLNNMGGNFRNRGKFKEAFDCYFKALLIAETRKDSASITPVLNNIGYLYRQQKRFDEALKYHLRCLEIRTALRDSVGIAISFVNFGELCIVEGKYSRALSYLRQAERIFAARKESYSLGLTYSYIGDAFVGMGSHDEALRWYSKAIPLRQAAQDQSGLATTYQQLGLLWGKMRQFDSARVYIELGINTSNALNMREITIQGYLNRAAIDSMQGNFAAAFAHYKQGIALKDSLYSLELIQQLDELQTRYDMKTKEQQILTLQRDKAEQSATRTKLLAGLGGLVLLALVVVAGYIRTRNKNIQLQTANAEIIRQRDILEEQAGEIELANSALNEKNLALERQQEILATQSREIELVNTALNENNQTLTQLNAEKNEFLGIAAHDLKSPLTGIMMSAAHLRLYYDRLSTDDRNHTLRRIEHVATVMNTIIENLLDINAIESGQLKVKSIPQSINALVATVIEHLTPNAAAKDINILTDLPERKLLVNIDGALATQVLQNLLSNAIKYSPLGKQVIVRVEEKYEGGSIKYENKYENRDGNNTNTPSLIPQHLSFLRVLVQDEGPGISADDQAKLFSKFTRLSAMPTAGEHSTGLGLSIVKRLVEAMQGRVWCESELGRGATFIVEFPLANELP